MPNAQTVSFLAPQDQLTLQLQQQQAQRQQDLAQALRQQSVAPIPTNQGPISWTQGFAKLAQAIAANHINRQSMASQYTASANATNSQARMLGATGNVLDPTQNPYATNESGRNLGQKIGDFIRGGAPIGMPQQGTPQAQPTPAPVGPAPSNLPPPPVSQLPAPNPGAMAAPSAVDPSAAGGQPSLASPSPSAMPDVPAPQAAPQRSPLALTGDWRTNMMLSQANPDEYSKALIGQQTPTDLGKMIAQSGIDPTSALGHQILQANIAKQNYIAPASARGGGYTQDPQTGQWSYHATLPEGSNATLNSDGSVASVSAIPGAAGVQTAMAAAKAGGNAQYQLAPVLGSDGKMRNSTVAEQAGGGGAPAAAPASGGLNGFYSHGAAPTASASNVTGLGPEQQAAATTAGGNSANGFNQAIQAGAGAKDSMRSLQNMLTASSNLPSGEGAEAISEAKSLGNSLVGGVFGGITDRRPFDQSQITNFNELKKNGANLAGQLSSAAGASGTDSRLANAINSLPNASYSPAANKEVNYNIQGLTAAANGRGLAATAWQQQNGPNSFPAFQQAWQKAYNPDLFYHQAKGDILKWISGDPNDRKTYPGMSTAAAAPILRQWQQLKALGGL